MLKILVEIVEIQKRSFIFLDTNRAAVVEYSIVQSVTLSPLNQEMI